MILKKKKIEITGEIGLEPITTVLETDVLPIKLFPFYFHTKYEFKKKLKIIFFEHGMKKKF